MKDKIKEILVDVYQTNGRLEDAAAERILLLFKNNALDSPEEEPEEEYEPYFGWCDVDGCHNEGDNGGGCWRETGYWVVCGTHSAEYRAGKPQPKMKQSAIDREKGRGTNSFVIP